MNVPLFVLFVEDQDRFLDRAETLSIETCEQLCQEFGGHFLRIISPKVPEAIAKTAEDHKITQIVLGESR